MKKNNFQLFTFDEWEEAISEKTLPDFSRIVLVTSSWNTSLPEPDSLLEVLDDRALALAAGALGGEWVVVEEPAGINDTADTKAGAADHARHGVDVHHYANSAGAAAGQVELCSEEELLKIGKFTNHLSDNVSAHESQVSGLCGCLRRCRSSGCVSGPSVARAVRDKDVISVGEVGIFRRIGGKDSSDSFNGLPTIG